MEIPIYKKELLRVGNKNSNIGLCTLWTEKEKVLKYISSENYLIAGQCYNKSEGVSLIIRHVLASKQIKYIVLCGADLNNTGDVLIALKEKGVNSERQIIGFKDSEIESEIPVEAINRFRDNVEIIDKRDVKDFSVLNEFLTTLPKTELWGEPEIFERLPPKKPDTYPSEKTSFVIRGKTIGETWLKILDTVLKFGYIKKSQYADDQKEINCLISVITDEDPNNIKWESYFKFTKEHLEKYYPQLMTSEIVGDVNYTYGSRLRDFKGINQIDSMVEQLKDAIYSRRAVAVTWDVEKDHDSSHSPCLDLIQALVQDKLHMTFYVRSNDMFRAWPENAFAFRKVQYEIASKVGIELGDLIIISNSAHIYSPNWQDAQKIILEYSSKDSLELDPRGNLHIELEGDRIKITHLTLEGKRINEFYVKTAMEAFQELSKRISKIDHALDIGVELGKAESALKLRLKYEQDKPL